MIIILAILLIVGAGVGVAAFSASFQIKHYGYPGTVEATILGILASIVAAFIVIPASFAAKDAVMENSNQKPRVSKEIEQLELILPGEYLQYVDSDSSLSKIQYKYQTEDGGVSTRKVFVDNTRIVESNEDAYVEVITSIEGDGFFIPLIAYKDYVFHLPE